MTILFNNLRRIFGRPVNIILMLVVPIVLNLFFISVGSLAGTYTIGVIDNDGSRLTETILRVLEDKHCDIVYYSDNEGYVRSALLNGEIDMVIRFAEDYEQRILAGQQATVQTFAIQETNQSEPVRLLIASCTAAAREFGRACGGDSAGFYEAMDSYLNGTLLAEYEHFAFTDEENVTRSVSSLGYLAMGMMFLMSFATSLLLEDKQTHVFSRLLTTPVSRASYLLQHLLSYVVVAVIQIVAVILLIPLVVDVTFGATWAIQAQVMVVTLLFAIVCIAIGLTISRFSRTSGTASAFISLVNLPVLMLGGCLWPRELMPEFVQRVGDFMPTTWFLSAAREVLYGGGLGAAWKQMLCMGALSAALLTLSFAVKTDDK